MPVSQTPYQEHLFKQLDELSQQRAYFAKTNRPDSYLALEPQVKELTYQLFNGEEADFYYAACLFDNSAVLANHHYLTEAKYYQQQGLSILFSLFGYCPYYHFINAVYTAKIAFYMEDYYTCIEEGSKANDLWYTKEYGQISVPLKNSSLNFSQTIDRIGTDNVLLLCNAYGKINTPQNSIELLSLLLQEGAFDSEQLISAEITLAELYIINEQANLAQPIYEKHKNSDFQNNPQLAAALASLSYIFETKVSPFTKELTNTLYCGSHNMFTISHYSYALGLVSAGKYEEALAHFRSSGTHGYSMQLLLLSKLEKISEIDALRETVNTYFYRQIEQIIVHYEEALAYNHLAKLQYQIDLSLNAYCHSALSAKAAYDFLLNTKYIALETSFLQQTYQKNLSQPYKRCLYTTERIQAQLTSDTLLLEYTTVRSLDTISYGVFVISQTDVHYIPLGDSKLLDPLITDWHELLQASVHLTGAALQKLSAKQQSLERKLRRSLYFPMQDLLTGYKHLFIAPAGSLISFPFCRLPCSSDKFLGDDYLITYLNTGKELRAPKDISSTNTALVIGNPQTTSFPNLPFAEIEADMVSYFLQTTSYKKDAASLENILAALKEAPSILHIAAHGIYQEFSSDRTVNWQVLYNSLSLNGILLAKDTLLSCSKISCLNLSSIRLAVLSCCYSAKAAYLGTEGAYGLRRAFRIAGCKAMIINLWEIDDAVSFLWMKAFYEHLTITGESIQESFFCATESIKTYSHNGSFPYQNPYYWAGFLLVSEY